jgi:hypothetical protein
MTFNSQKEAAVQVPIYVVEDRGSVVVAANYENYQSLAIFSDLIFLKVENPEYGNFASVGLSIDEAKKVAIALFDQIMYHEEKLKEMGY